MKHPIKIMQIGDGNFIRGFFDLAVEKLQVPCSIVSVAKNSKRKNTQTARRTKVTVQSDGTWAKKR